METLNQRCEVTELLGTWTTGSVYWPGRGWVVTFRQFAPASGWRGVWRFRDRAALEQKP